MNASSRSSDVAIWRKRDSDCPGLWPLSPSPSVFGGDGVGDRMSLLGPCRTTGPSRTTFQRCAAMGSLVRGGLPAGPRVHWLATIGSRGEARTGNGQDGSSLARWTEQGIARSQRRAADEAFSESRNVAWAAKRWLPAPAT